MNLSVKEAHRLKNRYGDWAIVTGATSGIGLELAKQLAHAGFHLILNGRSEERLRNVERQLMNQTNKIVTVAADLSEAEGRRELILAADRLNVGLLINNAGYGTSGLFVDSTLDTETNMLRLNCEAVLSLTHFFSRRFKQQKRGGIIFLSSLVAFQGVPFAANYAATKAYIQSFAEALALELKPFGTDVLSVAPGPVNSSFAARANMNLGMTIPAHELAVPILSALGKKTSVIPGLRSKLLIYGLHMAPRNIRVRIMSKVMDEFTKHQR